MSAEHHHVELRPEQVTIPPGHSWNRLPVIGAALGHRNLKTTQQVYALATREDVRAAMERAL